MRVLVLGGTGAMGIYLTKILAEAGHDIVVTSRRLHKNDSNITYVQGNALCADFVNILMTTHWDVIIDFMVYTTEIFKNRYRLLLNSCSQYLFISSSRVYAQNLSPITENSNRLLDVSIDEQYLRTKEYALMKARQEDVIRNSKYNNWTIIRPYITYSNNRFQLGIFEKEAWLYRAIKGRSIVIDNQTCERLTSLTYGLDVAKAMNCLIGNRETFGQVFNIVTDESIRWECVLVQYLDVIERKFKFRPNVVKVDSDDLLKIIPVEYQLKYDRCYDRVFDNSKINNFFHGNTFTKVNEGLVFSLYQFLEDPQFGHISWRSEAVKDRYTKERTPISEIGGFKAKLVYILFRYFYVITNIFYK